MSYIRVFAFICVVLGLAGVPGDYSLSGQTAAPGASQFGIGSFRHQTHAELETSLDLPTTNEFPSEIETFLPPPPTRSSFMATWLGVSRAKGYLLDVSTSSSFDSFVDGYHDLDVGNVTGRVVTGLNRGTRYYYRVRAYDATARTGYSETIPITTEPTTGLTIHPTFDSSITGNPNAAAIQATINGAIAIYESLFSDPITIQIRFRYATTAPDGSHLPQGLVSESDTALYIVRWNAFVSALRADAETNNDDVANASLPGSALSTNIRPTSANGRAVGLNTPPVMFADGTVGQGGQYDGIVTLNSSKPFQFGRPVNPNSFDAQHLTEHEIDEVIGLGSHLGQNGNDLSPQDLFSWSSAGNRNTTSSGTRYFSINSGATNIIGFNQDPDGDFGDWLSEPCPQAHPYVQNAFSCTGQSSDIAATSPEGINLDVIGYDLENAPPAGVTDDFNNDGHADYLLFNEATRATVIWYMNNNVHISGNYGPAVPTGWSVVAVADFNGDGHPDYLLFNEATRATVIWYMNNNVHVSGNNGPAVPTGWSVVGAVDFDGNGRPDYLLYNSSTHQTAIWYMNNNVRIGTAYGPTLPSGWSVVAVADFNGDGHPDYLLFNEATRATVIWYMNNNVHVSGNNGPAVPTGWSVVGAVDFDGNGRPDYLLYNSSTHQTAIWYMNNNVRIGTAYGPTLPSGWSLVAP